MKRSGVSLRRRIDDWHHAARARVVGERFAVERPEAGVTKRKKPLLPWSRPHVRRAGGGGAVAAGRCAPRRAARGGHMDYTWTLNVVVPRYQLAHAGMPRCIFCALS